MNSSILTAAQQTASAKTRRPRAGQWDLFAVVGLMVCSAAYSICTIAGAAGF